MKRALVLCIALITTTGLPTLATAQEADEQETPYWYVSYYSVDWSRTDSLTNLWERTAPVRALQKENGEILEWIGLIHQVGNEKNVVTMTKYPFWDAIDEQSDAFETVFPNAAERALLNDGFNWVYGSGAHQDVIYTESPGSVMPSPEDTTEGAFWYASFYEIPWARVDSLNTLWTTTADVPAEAQRNGSILGSIGLIHHTGVQPANVVTLTKYPSWEALEDRSWGEAFSTVEPDSVRRAELNDGYSYVYTGAPHYDVIYVQPTQ